MSAAALIVVRDEEDIIEPVLRHACWEVDEAFVAFHCCTDRTQTIVRALRREGLPIRTSEFVGRAFHGDAFWSSLAQEARKRGHDWGIVWDADEIWHVTGPTVRIADFLADAEPEVWVYGAESFNHIPSYKDDWEEQNPVLRTRWRQTLSDTLKTAFRLLPNVRYAAHLPHYSDEPSPPSRPGLSVRHFTIRTPEQLIAKVRNGMDGYSVEAGQPEGHDAHWESWKGLDEAAITRRFYSEFWSQNPVADPFLIDDPAPLKP